LNQKAKELDKQQREFQNKIQNNAFLSQERAEQEYKRIAKLEQDLQELSNKLQTELMSEQEKNSLLLRDSINSFMKDYNKEKGYSFIISNTNLDNLLYADEQYNITQEVVDGLNARYSSPASK
jgi:outer membrane protein